MRRTGLAYIPWIFLYVPPLRALSGSRSKSHSPGDKEISVFKRDFLHPGGLHLGAECRFPVQWNHGFLHTGTEVSSLWNCGVKLSGILNNYAMPHCWFSAMMIPDCGKSLKC